MRIKGLGIIVVRSSLIAIACLFAISCARTIPASSPDAQPPSYHPLSRESGSGSHQIAGLGHGVVSATDLSGSTDPIDKLKSGNQRFVYGRGEHPHQSISRRVELASGQKPHSIVLSCADSRVPPEIVFDQGLGDIFVVRTAGEVLDASAVASLEYAVEHLGSKLLVVMGHQSCGAVKAAITTPPNQSAGSKDLDALVRGIRPNLSGLSAFDLDVKANPLLSSAAKAQALGVKKALLARSHIIKEAYDHHGLQIKPALYNLESGEVEFF